MKKHLIAVLLTACLLFSFGTTAFAEPSGGQEPNANNSATQDEKGHFGYYLSDKNAKWENDQLPTDVGELEAYTDNGKVKYKETRIVENGNKTTVTSAIPTLEGHTFLGWGDKERKGNSAAIRIAGDELIYCYENNDIYTVDALWGSLTLEGGSKPYDGTPITLSAATFTLNDNGLDPKYSGPYYNLLDCSAPIKYSTKYSTDEENWKNLNDISFTDVGTYTLYARQKVKLKERTDYKEVEVVGQATYTITPRLVTLTSASAEKEYDGKPLTNGCVTADGFVNGDGVTITVTGTQTEVGSSDNTFTYEPKDNNTNLSNYEIKPIYGKLTVTENTTPTPDTTPTPTPTPVVTPAPTAAPSTDDTTPENTATPAPTATAAPTATPAPAPTAAPAAARAATTIPQTGDNFPAVVLVIVMLAAIVGLGITVVLRTDKKK
ncbi:hypothetical protein [Gemmiger sp.]|uniref:hypothetical protein n=1 Tax=Gemmiger sp. TaxID=2049027 RepID=UPI003A93F5FE